MKRIDFKLRDKFFRDSVDKCLDNVGLVLFTEGDTRIYRNPLLNVAAEAYSLNADISLQDHLHGRLPLFDFFVSDLYSSEKRKMWCELKRNL